MGGKNASGFMKMSLSVEKVLLSPFITAVKQIITVIHPPGCDNAPQVKPTRCLTAALLWNICIREGEAGAGLMQSKG